LQKGQEAKVKRMIEWWETEQFCLAYLAFFWKVVLAMPGKPAQVSSSICGMANVIGCFSTKRGLRYLRGTWQQLLGKELKRKAG